MLLYIAKFLFVNEKRFIVYFVCLHGIIHIV